MKRTSTIWWIAAVVLALLAGLVTYQTLASAMPASSAEGSLAETRPVVVAAADIPIRRSISVEELSLDQLPANSVPEGAAASFDQVVGKMASQTVFAGQPVLMQGLVTPDIVTKELALSVPEGKVVMAVPIRSMLLSNRLVRPGDHIDLIGSFEITIAAGENGTGTDQRPESIAALYDLEVHAIILPSVAGAVGEAAKGEQPEPGTFASANADEQAVLLAIDVQDALVLRHILDFGGTLDLVLRAPADETLATTVPVDSNYLMDRYQILIPH